MKLGIDKLYLVPEIPNNPNQFPLLYGLLDIIFRLKRQGFTILMGFSEVWAVLGFPFLLDGFASSGLKNRRSFKAGQWRGQGRSGGRGPTYYHFWTHKLLGSIKFPQEAEKLLKVGLWEELDSASPYAPIFDGSSPKTIFDQKRWTFGKSQQNYSWMMTQLAKSYDGLEYIHRLEHTRSLILDAKHRYNFLARNNIQLDSMGEHLDTWLQALDVFIENNRDQIHEEYA